MNARWFLALFLTLAGMAPLYAEKPVKTVDLAICLDTSNSMDGLIDAAKIKLWRIVNDLAKIDPAPRLRVALLSYGNNSHSPANGWVRKEVDLTYDIDEVYRKLFDLRTNGGTELVARVCRDALVDLKWSDDRTGLRIVFVCGNEPADQDKEVSLSSVVNLAKKKDVVVNTIYCQYGRPEEESGWRLFSELAGGKHAVIDQNKKIAIIDTPYDKEIRDHNDRINRTYVPLGRDGARGAANQQAQDKNALSASGGGYNERAIFKSSKLYNCEWDICDKFKTDPKFDISKVKDEDLPEEMRKLTKDQKLAYIQKKIAERDEITNKITDLAKKRAKYIEEAEKKLPAEKGDKAFDDAVRSIIKEQAKAKDMKIPE